MVAEKVAIVIPTPNEEATIHQLLAELPQDFAQWVIVVDNGSTHAERIRRSNIWSDRDHRTCAWLRKSLFKGVQSSL